MLRRETINRAKFMRHTQAHSLLTFMKQTGEPSNCQVGARELRSFSVPFGDESTELLLTQNLAFGLWGEVNIKNVIVDALSAMRTNGVVMGNPEVYDVVYLPTTQPYNVVQCLFFERTYPALDESVRHWCAYRRFHSSCRTFPETKELFACEFLMSPKMGYVPFHFRFLIQFMEQLDPGIGQTTKFGVYLQPTNGQAPNCT